MGTSATGIAHCDQRKEATDTAIQGWAIESMLRPAPPKAESTTAEVTSEDQRNINAFSKLNSHKDELKDDLQELEDELVRLRETSDELMMVLEDDIPIKFKFGECFFDLPKDEVESRVEQQIEITEQKKSQLEKQITDIQVQLHSLKATLYGKFGKSIHLETDD
jgi:prefoldin subunit 4